MRTGKLYTSAGIPEAFLTNLFALEFPQCGNIEELEKAVDAKYSGQEILEHIIQPRMQTLQYALLLCSKRDTSNRHWVARRTLKEIKEVADCWSDVDWFKFIHAIDKELL